MSYYSSFENNFRLVLRGELFLYFNLTYKFVPEPQNPNNNFYEQSYYSSFSLKHDSNMSSTLQNGILSKKRHSNTHSTLQNGILSKLKSKDNSSNAKFTLVGLNKEMGLHYQN